MNKQLYYVVEKEISSDNETLSGNKSIIVYEIINNVPKKFCSIDCANNDRAGRKIQEYLDDNGYEDAFDLVQL